MARSSYSIRDSRRTRDRTRAGAVDRIHWAERLAHNGFVFGVLIGALTSAILPAVILRLIGAAFPPIQIYLPVLSLIFIVCGIVFFFIFLILTIQSVRGLRHGTRPLAEIRRKLTLAGIIGILTVVGSILVLLAARALSGVGSGRESVQSSVKWCCVCRGRATQTINGKWYCDTHSPKAFD